MNLDRQLTADQARTLMETLEARFTQHMHRHADIAWPQVQEKLQAAPEKLWSLQQMEQTGGEPDVVGYDKGANTFDFYDCSPETPSGRRNLCYDREALLSRKANRPENSAMDVATEMGIALLTEAQYRALQQMEAFDTKTSSWVVTPDTVRKLGGAFFCDRRYDYVFTYHNGADSYYAARGFRGALTV